MNIPWLRLVLSLLLGAAITVAVAVRAARNEQWAYDRYTLTETTALQWPCSVPANWPNSPAYVFRHTRPDAQMRSYGIQVTRAHHTILDLRYGWPLPALGSYSVRTTIAGDPTRTDSTTDQHLLIFKIPITPPKQVSIPTRPIPLGFLADTALFAFPLFLVTAGPGILRRTLRRRRGHCPACGYDVQHTYTSPCPECGSHNSA